MGDRTTLNFRAHACPDDQLDALTAAVVEHLDGTDLDHFGFPTLRDAIAGSEEMYAEEVSVGLILEADLQAVAQAAPGAFWEAWTDPKYEWQGDWVGYHPDLGLIGPLECTSEGQQSLDYGQVSRVLDGMPDGCPDGNIDRAKALTALFPQHAFYEKVRDP